MDKQMEQSNVNNRYEEIISIIGFDSFIKMSRHYGGTSVYVPAYENISRDFKYKMIMDELFKSGLSVKELAVKYGVSERTIYRLIRKRRDTN